jgi:hypothetical protein
METTYEGFLKPDLAVIRGSMDLSIVCEGSVLRGDFRLPYGKIENFPASSGKDSSMAGHSALQTSSTN